MLIDCFRGGKSNLKKTMEQIGRMLNAKSIAVIGASSNPGKWGYMFLENILRGGYSGRLYAVNPKAKEILGVPSYPSILEIPDTIDLLIITIPVESVFDAIKEGIEKKAIGAVLITAGFREAGRYDLEETLIKVIEDSEFRIIGPNIAGINYVPNKLSANVTMVFEKPGPIGIISQSGSVSAILAQWAEYGGIGITGLINLGNQVDLCETDFLEYFKMHEETKVISLYLEGVKNKEKFKKVLPDVTKEKPVVIFKPGKTDLGKKVVISHTASIAGNDKIFSFACKQYGAIRVDDLESFFDTSKFFALNPLPKGNRVFAISSSGGLAGIVADEMSSNNLLLPAFSEEIAKEFESRVNIGGSNYKNNPIDMPSFTPEEYCTILEIADKYDLADMYLIILADPVKGIEDHLPAVIKKANKPTAIIYVGGGEAEAKGTIEMQKKGIPVYNSPERAVRSMGRALWYAQKRLVLSNE